MSNAERLSSCEASDALPSPHATYPDNTGIAMFRFTIRDVLWLTVVVGVLAAWWLDHDRLEQKAAKLKSDAQMSRAVDGLGTL